MELRSDPRGLLHLQADMASALLGAQESKRCLEGDLEAHASCDAWHVDQIEVGVRVSKAADHVIRQIADGIAWRALRYDRPVIYELSSKPQTGHLDLGSIEQEIASAEVHLEETGETVIVNDLTNFLRFGDFTSVGPDWVRIAECKGGRGSRRSGRAKRQRRHLQRSLDFLNAGIRQSDEGVEKLFHYSTEPKSHLGTVGRLIREAKAGNGAAHDRLSDCLAVDVICEELLPDMSGGGDMRKLLHNPFAQSREATIHCSLDFFDRFSRNLAPYSVYPFDAEDRADIMTGHVWLFTYFNRGNLVRCLRRRGLSVDLPTRQQVKAYLDMDPGERRRHEDQVGILVGHVGDPYCVLIYGALLARLAFEFLDEESFADAAEEVIEERDIGALHIPGFRNESILWD